MIRLTLFIALLSVAVPGYAAVPFETATASYQDAARERVWDGRVEAVNQATVSAQTSGRIAELPFDVNDYVAAGDVVMRFTDTEQKAVLSRAEASLQEARARLAEASQAYERYSKMIENNSVSQSQLVSHVRTVMPPRRGSTRRVPVSRQHRSNSNTPWCEHPTRASCRNGTSNWVNSCRRVSR